MSRIAKIVLFLLVPASVACVALSTELVASMGAVAAKEDDRAAVKTTVVAEKLDAPWGLAFLPNGDALVTERDTRRLLKVTASGKTEVVQRLPSDGQGEGGLLGLAVSPHYKTDRFVYAYVSTSEDNRVVRFRLGERPKPVLTGIPGSVIHNGGRIAFGPDGMLYITTGDAGESSNAQDLGSLGGKILRSTPDGKVPASNPFPDSYVWSFGHRNVQGLAWDRSARLYATEFGADRFDEVNRIRPGRNYGWPKVEGNGGEPRFEDPVAAFRPAKASPSGAEILKRGAIPQWEGDFFMACLRGERLWRLELGKRGEVVGRKQLLKGKFGRLRNVSQAPDGSLWIFTANREGGAPASNDDRILRLGP